MAAPIRHHFLPEFYLKQWAREDGRLVEYKIPFGTIVKPKSVHPKATGFIHRLYAIEGLPDHLANELESGFLSPVDSRAAEAMAAMQNGREYNPTQRIAWASFIATLLSRMPRDIQIVKDVRKDLAETILPEFREVFEYYKPRDEIRTFEEWVEEAIAKSNLQALGFVRLFMSNEGLIHGIAAMEWSVLLFPMAKFGLLTSDRPVIHTQTFADERSHIMLPLGARALFVAAPKRSLISEFRSIGQDKLVAAVNALVVGAADNYVYGSDDSQLRFVQNRIGKAKVPTIVDRLRETQLEKYRLLLRAALNDMSLTVENR